VENPARELLSRLTEIMSMVKKNPSSEELCQLLGTSVCFTGELARVYLGRLDSDGIIRTEASFGYSLDSDAANIETDLGLDRPMPYALRRREVYFANREEVVAKFKNYEPLDTKSPWTSTAVLPTEGALVFVFRFQCEFENFGWEQGYFDALRSILDFYNLEIGRSQNSSSVARLKAKIEHDKKKVVRGKPLTPRQIEILNQIKEKRTNIQIANSLGYSESLIRQETIIIYAKLGVEGRKDLILPDETLPIREIVGL
jgi:DNA-binding CsgD family transcriptional regulator